MGWSATAASLEASVAAVFDEVAFTLVPMAAGPTGVNATPSADLERAGFAFLGSIDHGPQILLPAFQASRSISPVPLGSGSGVSHEAVISALASAWPWRPRIGDRIASGDVIWQIAAMPRDGSDRVALYVNRARL